MKFHNELLDGWMLLPGERAEWTETGLSTTSNGFHNEMRLFYHFFIYFQSQK